MYIQKFIWIIFQEGWNMLNLESQCVLNFQFQFQKNTAFLTLKYNFLWKFVYFYKYLILCFFYFKKLLNNSLKSFESDVSIKMFE